MRKKLGRYFKDISIDISQWATKKTWSELRENKSKQ